MKHLLLSLSLTFAGSAWAQEVAEVADASDATEATDGVEAVVQMVGDLDWTGLKSKAGSSQWEAAATELVDHLKSNPRDPRAWTILGDALHTGKLPYAALVAWSKGAELSPTEASASYPELLAASEKLGEELWVGEFVGADFGVDMDAETRSKAAYQAARYHFSQENWGTALGVLFLVDGKSSMATKGLILQGITFAQQSRYDEALPLLLAAEAKLRSDKADAHDINALQLNIARTEYAADNLDGAAQRYTEVERADSYWPTAQFEKAWAHFAAKDYGDALGTLQTHHSAFFSDWYFPEAELLRAQSLFVMCKFPSATEAIDTFQAAYTPVSKDLQGQLARMNASEVFADVAAYTQGNSHQISERMLRRYQWDDRFTGAVAALDQADAELATLGGKSGSWSKPVAEMLKARANARRMVEGQRIKDSLAYHRAELDDMLRGIELTRVDLLTLEAKLYEQAANGVKISDEERKTQFRNIRKSGKRVWPFEGETWADELGWYRVVTKPECPQSLTGLGG